MSDDCRCMSETRIGQTDDLKNRYIHNSTYYIVIRAMCILRRASRHVRSSACGALFHGHVVSTDNTLYCRWCPLRGSPGGRKARDRSDPRRRRVRTSAAIKGRCAAHTQLAFHSQTVRVESRVATRATRAAQYVRARLNVATRRHIYAGYKSSLTNQQS
ncbi:hypothetical protein EVAR_46545_1 [Eumeta japonica]|uniref:Uncharacterized protein n=1 Tax=Eumeta variegata TaxID=151549 RepID=A0A4C1XL41_EUMVA|nr:hypothetical protein EVAR_46545_1 [Eumeta japonica]